MKKLAVLALIVFFASCSRENPEAIQKQLISYKDKVNDLNNKIADLEQKLETMGDSAVEESGTVVKIKEVRPETFKHFVEISGKVIANDEAMLSAETNGKVSQLHIKEGDYVTEGRLLVSLNTDLTEKSIREVRTNLELMEKLYEKQKNLWDQNIGTELEYLQAKNNYEAAQARLASLEEQLDMAQVRAPFNGIVNEIMVEKGEMAAPGAPVLHIVNMEDFNLEGNISENFLNDIRVGEIVDISFPTFPGMNYELPVSRVGNVIDNMSRTFKVEVKFNNREGKIKPNQLSVMKINDFTDNEALVVPSIVIKQDVTGNYLYVVKENGEGPSATKVYVEPGRSFQEYTMIESGLNPGDKVIVEGYNLVKDGSLVEIISE